jgi:hypothetical protein
VATGSQLEWSVPAEDPEQLGRVDTATPGDAVLAVRGEGEVLRTHRPAGTDLRGLLAEQWHPDAELTLPLQRVALPVEPPDQNHVPVQALEQFGRHIQRKALVGGEDPLGAEQLHQAPAGGGAQPGDDLRRGGGR